jgi:hypothetical protein
MLGRIQKNEIEALWRDLGLTQKPSAQQGCVIVGYIAEQ